MSQKVKPPGIGDAVGGLGMVGIMALAVLPLPSFALDILLATSLCVAVLVFLLALYVEKPLEFSSFPSLLLLITLFRLSLNVASTRLILLNGSDGLGAAGKVIRAFGEFAIGGNFVVGAVVFLILVIVNFIVITKGAERVSEVAARFTLDSMPGKQMAIDADLGAGLIDEKQARARRLEIEREADFHGSMDGASKFVRGDAIAGLLIVGINIIGGMVVGVAQGDMSFGDAARTYTILSIGDGLVSQLPALLISTGSAILATRESAAQTLGTSLAKQLFSRSKPPMVAALVLVALALVPGMPHISFLSLAAGAGYIAYRAHKREQAGEEPEANEADAEHTQSATEVQKTEIEAMLPVELLALEVGLDLLPLVDSTQAGELLARIGSLRKQMAGELGFIVPPVHVRDNLRLRPGAYEIQISGVTVAKGEVRAGQLLAIDPGDGALARISGEEVREPTFGLPARWIPSSERARAEAAGCTVVDPSAVVATHLTEIVRRHASELLGRREAQELLDLAAKRNAKVVEELVPNLLSLGDVIGVLRSLLREAVSIRDIRTILETLADQAVTTKEHGELTETVRHRLARPITRANASSSGELRAMVLDPRAEDLFRAGSRSDDGDALTQLTSRMEEAARQAMTRNEPAVLVTAPDVRQAVAAVATRHVPGLAVMSYREIDPEIPFVSSGVVAANAAPRLAQ